MISMHQAVLLALFCLISGPASAISAFDEVPPPAAEAGANPGIEKLQSQVERLSQELARLKEQLQSCRNGSAKPDPSEPSSVPTDEKGLGQTLKEAFQKGYEKARAQLQSQQKPAPDTEQKPAPDTDLEQCRAQNKRLAQKLDQLERDILKLKDAYADLNYQYQTEKKRWKRREQTRWMEDERGHGLAMENRKVYENQPLTLFNGQVTIHLLLSDYRNQKAFFDLTVHTRRLNMDLAVGQRRKFEYRGKVYILQLEHVFPPSRQCALISIYSHL